MPEAFAAQKIHAVGPVSASINSARMVKTGRLPELAA